MSPHLLENCKTFSSERRFVAFFQTLEDLNRASCGLSSVALKRTGCDFVKLTFPVYDEVGLGQRCCAFSFQMPFDIKTVAFAYRNMERSLMNDIIHLTSIAAVFMFYLNFTRRSRVRLPAVPLSGNNLG